MNSSEREKKKANYKATFSKKIEEVSGNCLADSSVFNQYQALAEMVMERYTRVLKPMHQQFIEPTKRYADLIIPQGGNNQVAIDILTMFIEKNLDLEK